MCLLPLSIKWGEKGAWQVSFCLSEVSMSIYTNKMYFVSPETVICTKGTISSVYDLRLALT